MQRLTPQLIRRIAGFFSLADYAVLTATGNKVVRSALEPIAEYHRLFPIIYDDRLSDRNQEKKEVWTPEALQLIGDVKSQPCRCCRIENQHVAFRHEWAAVNALLKLGKQAFQSHASLYISLIPIRFKLGVNITKKFDLGCKDHRKAGERIEFSKNDYVARSLAILDCDKPLELARLISESKKHMDGEFENQVNRVGIETDEKYAIFQKFSLRISWLRTVCDGNACRECGCEE